MNIQIEKGIEIPDTSMVGILEKETPIAKMEIGDSFLYPDNGKLESLVTRIATYGKRTEKSFLTKTTEGGKRIWRTA